MKENCDDYCFFRTIFKRKNYPFFTPVCGHIGLFLYVSKWIEYHEKIPSFRTIMSGHISYFLLCNIFNITAISSRGHFYLNLKMENALPDGFEPSTFRLTAERANHLRHRDNGY